MGDIVLRLLSDEVMPEELREFLIKLRDSKKLRNNCGSLGTLVDPATEEHTRREIVVALITFLLYEVDPTTKPPGSPFPSTEHWPRKGEADLRALLSERGTKWDRHTLRTKGRPRPVDHSKCYLSDELWKIVMALEDLWGLQGIYVDRTNLESAADIMKDQLTRRGAITNTR